MSIIYKILLLIVITVCVTLIETSSESIVKSENSTIKNPIALILARGGSKGIKLKNLANVKGTSLLGRSIAVVKSSKIFDEIWVSTDHKGIADEARKYGAMVHYRSKETSLDTTTSIESVQEFLLNHSGYEHIALIQCTSVFLRKKYLELAYKLFQKSDCVFSVVRSYKLRWSYNENIKKLSPINFCYKNRPRRQDWNGELLETGMFYFADKSLLEKGTFQNDQCNFVEIDSKDALEVDTYEDLELANVLAELYNY